MRGSVDVLCLVFNRTFDSVSQDVFAGEEQLGTATVVVKEASPLSTTAVFSRRVPVMK